jgi:GTPase
LQALYNRKVPQNKFIHAQLGRTISEISRQISRQVGLLIDRGGTVSYVIIGNAHQLFIPDLSRHRAGHSRFRGLRLIHTHLRGESLSKDDLTDLTLLQLDTIVVLHVTPDGLPRSVEFAYLYPEAKEGQDPWLIEQKPSIYDWPDDYLHFIQDLESRFSKRDSIKRIAGKEGAVLIGVTTGSKKEALASLRELERLSNTAGLQPLDTSLQKRKKKDGKFVVGKGKLQDTLIKAMQLNADVLVFDQELTPSQLRNIAVETNLKVVDRTQLILDIFAQRAKSREGKLQVEIAQLRYRKPRIKIMPTAMSRLTGGIGGRGPGETKLEINKRRADERLNRLEKELMRQSRSRSLRRERRKKARIPQVSLVGYTNAGKSTLLNAMTKSNVDAEDKLFATLDPTSRRFRFPRDREIILTDTVGFIRNLPKELVEAFRSTFEETLEADLILQVADAGDPELETHLREVDDTLRRLKAEEIPRLLIFNKIDTVDATRWSELALQHQALLCSATTRHNLDKLLEAIEQNLFTIRQGNQ